MAITLHVHNSHDNGGSGGSTTCVVTLNGVGAGDLVVVEFAFITSGGNTFVSVADNANPGNYIAAVAAHANAATGATYGIYYMPNSVSGNLTITLTMTVANVGAAMACQAWSGAAASSPLDSSFSQQQDGTTSNPTTGGNKTPSGNGELVIAACGFNAQTGTPGTNYTAIDSISGELYFPEYWIQTNATATNGAFVATADSWTDQMAAFAPILPSGNVNTPAAKVSYGSDGMTMFGNMIG